MAKREPDPLIPEDELKKFVGAVAAVPKEEVAKIEAERTQKKSARPPPQRHSGCTKG